ncbi:MAG TPA: cytochrome P450 [Methylomirabilota bacterium]|nr:cytochrome P450 [Methylomirabilota bacterium]
MKERPSDMLPSVRELLSPAGLRDPYAVYSRFRDAEAAGHDIGHVVVRYDQVVGVLGDRRLSSERVGAILGSLGNDVRDRCPFVERTLQGIVAFRDPPDHTRIRNLLASTFSPPMVKRVADMIEGISTRLLDAVAADGEADLHRAYSYPLPALVVGAMLGIPEADIDRFQSWALDIVLLVGSGSPTGQLAMSAQKHFAEMREYLRALVSARRRDPGDELLSAMIGAADHDNRLSEDEIFANATFLMTAGHETATNMLSNGVVTLLRHPDQLERLRRDRSLIPLAAEEILRFESPVQMTSRRALVDGEFAGRRVKAGDALQLFLGAANRDPARFPAPDRFDIARTDNRHVAFGFGSHFCLGAALAREELRIALTHLLDRLPGLELTIDEVTWQPTIDFRGPLSLPVRWRPGA